MAAKKHSKPKPEATASTTSNLAHEFDLLTNPLIDTLAGVQDNLSRIYAYAAFLQSASEQMKENPMHGEHYGRTLAHEVLTNALAYLNERRAA
jgi:hypothetical protein